MSKSTAELTIENGIGLGALFNMWFSTTNPVLDMAVGMGAAYAFQYLAPSAADTASDPLMGAGFFHYAASAMDTTPSSMLIMMGSGAGLAYYFRSEINEAINF